MLRRFRFLPVLLLFFLPLLRAGAEPAAVSSAGPAEDAAERPAAKTSAERPFYQDLLAIKQLQFSTDKWLGFNGAAGYRGLRLFQGVDTVLWVTLGMALQRSGYFYYPDGTVYSGDDSLIDPDHDPFYYLFDFHYSFGISQGILYFPEEDRNLLEFFSFFRIYNDFHFRDDRYSQLIFQSGLPDSDGILFSELLAGFSWDSVRTLKPSKVKKGIEAELTFSWAPDYFLNNQFGKAQYIGFHGDFRAFLPYFEKISEKGMNLISLYQAWWFHAEYVSGGYIPVTVRGHTTGRYWATAMGGGVRGVDANRYDAPVKITASTELRLQLPAVGVKSLIPGLLVYFDSGYYHYPGGERAGVLLAAGGGVFIDLFGIAKLAFYSEYFINGVRVNGKHFTPFEFSLGLLY